MKISKSKNKYQILPTFPSSSLSRSRGFTLIETLVAITVLLLAIVGPLQIAAQALFSAFYSREQITAYYLAAESIEYIKNSRDVMFLNDVFNEDASPAENSDWLLGLAECVVQADTVGCAVNSKEPFMSGSSLNPSAIVACETGSGCPPLRFDSTSGIWDYDSSHAPSKFRRTVVIIPQQNNGNLGEEALIEATVEWAGNVGFGGVNKRVVVKGLMTNWERK